MSNGTISKLLVFMLWGVFVYGSLKLAEVPGNWGHGLCGPWGCAPPIQSLLACHLAWLITLLIVTETVWHYTREALVVRIFYSYILSAVAMLIYIFCNDYFNWYLQASEYQKTYFLHRLGFSVCTHIELPIFQLFFSAGWLVFRKGLSGNKDSDSKENSMPENEMVAKNA